MARLGRDVQPRARGTHDTVEMKVAADFVVGRRRRALLSYSGLRFELALDPRGAPIAAREVGAVCPDCDGIRAIAEHVEERLASVWRVVRALPRIAGIRSDERDLVMPDGHAVLLIREAHGRQHFL